MTSPLKKKWLNFKDKLVNSEDEFYDGIKTSMTGYPKHTYIKEYDDDEVL